MAKYSAVTAKLSVLYHNQIQKLKSIAVVSPYFLYSSFFFFTFFTVSLMCQGKVCNFELHKKQYYSYVEVYAASAGQFRLLFAIHICPSLHFNETEKPAPF